MNWNQYIDPLLARLTIGAAILISLAIAGAVVTN